MDCILGLICVCSTPQQCPIRRGQAQLLAVDVGEVSLQSYCWIDPVFNNYGKGIEILKKRFENRQMIISRHMKILLNLSAVSREHDLRALRWLYNEVEANVRSLKALGVGRDSYGTMLTSVLLTKLPPKIRLIVTRKASGTLTLRR